jgi:twitching motility two-component system response regulator PilH
MTEPKRHILVVDDSTELQEFFRLVLEEAGYDVTTVSSGDEGLAKAKTLKPALILLDLVMPGMDGLEFLTRLRSDFAPPLPPTILCSGFELTEEEALRRGALMFVRKPVAPEDLREFVALGLIGERVSAETAARERANSAVARTRIRNTATTFVARIRQEAEQRAAGQMAWLAAYFGLETAVSALMEDGRLTVFAAAGDRSLTVGVDLAKRLPPCHEILESGSSLVLADASVHPCFSAGPYRLEGVRFFAGVPLLSPDGDPIGVVCLVDAKARRTYAEDLTILEQVGRQGSLLLRLLALGQPASELPGRLGPGMMLRPSLELLVDAELRRLRQSTGSMEVAVVEMDDPQQMREAVLHARNPERLGAGALGPTRVAVYKRHPLDGAAGEIRTLLVGLERTTQLRAVGAAGIGGTQLPAVTGQDLIRLAELTLEQTLQTGGGTQRLVLQHEVSGTRDALTLA